MTERTKDRESEMLLRDLHILSITGVTGYIEFQTIITAIERKYRVRAVRKSPAITSALAQGQLEFALVPDLLSNDAVANALGDVTVIIHLASPLSDNYESSIIKPTVSMVTTILEAARRIKTIHRVISTSSRVTLIPFEWNMKPDSERHYTEDDLNDKVIGPFSNAMEAYWAAKALTRMATIRFFGQGNPQFDIVNLIPSVVIGPDHRLDHDETATRENLLEGTRCALPNPPFDYVGAPVHVADAARVHVDAVDRALVPGNSEYILCSDSPERVVWDGDVQRIARQHFPGEVENKTLPLEGSLGTALRSERIFGQFTSFEETMKELIEQYLRLRKVE
ncbi:NAD-dependent epimerase/dehydratase [Penicillium sp. IBT 35674x]|nr:NAD-dependent epimerase/dehydratase [Penicillium sp. IBT 35674x]